MADSKISALAEITTPATDDEFAIVDKSDTSMAATGTDKKITDKTIALGWTFYTTVVPTRASADDPTYVMTFAGVDLTDMLSVGMRLKWTQNSTVRYGIVTAISFSTNTSLTLYGGTDYDVDDTGTYAITNFAFSANKAPQGFPFDITKWQVVTTDTTSRNQASPVSGTWYNLGSISISIPIGSWKVEYKVLCRSNLNSATYTGAIKTTLSTANNSESDAEFTSGWWDFFPTVNFDSARTLASQKNLTLASKTVYYLNSTVADSSNTNITNRNDIVTLYIRAVSAYL